MKITRRQVLYQKADQIEREAHRGNPVILHQKKPSRWRAGIAYGSRRFYDKKDIDARIEALKGGADYGN